jgi:hypothetical protein
MGVELRWSDMGNLLAGLKTQVFARQAFRSIVDNRWCQQNISIGQRTLQNARWNVRGLAECTPM